MMWQDGGRQKELNRFLLRAPYGLDDLESILLKPFWPKFMDKTCLGKFRFVMMTLHGFKIQQCCPGGLCYDGNFLRFSAKNGVYLKN
jgi:hypothetical protein